MSNPQVEMRLLARASFSGFVATLVDLGLYQMVLWLGMNKPRLYVLAAVLGAASGAATNFLISRYWAFRRTEKPIAVQGAQYALVSALTYVALQATLSLLVEVGHVDARIAVFPAKAVAWMAVSYPLARFVVFGDKGSRA